MSSSRKRLIVVSNRLPITITPISDGQWSYDMSSGGLVSALKGLHKDEQFIWIGWPGLEIPLEQQANIIQDLNLLHSCVPVFIDNLTADLHYNGFSNRTNEINFDESHWAAYQKVNALFADVVASFVQEGDTVWVHDYHLMLLPLLLRQKIQVNLKIGFFLHTPFPSSEIYRILPSRKQILLGLLACNLIGFHTYDYVRHFLSSCTRILGLFTLPNSVMHNGKIVHVSAFPIGINPDQFISEKNDNESVKARIAFLKNKFKGQKVIIGVDRLDYIKGIPQKLHGFEIFLETHPEWTDKIVFIQVGVPSRQDVEEYQQLRIVVNELVGRINGRFGSIEHAPIHFLHKSFDFDELVALYTIADACIVTSSRDGMNLVSYEFIACQQENHGVLILSEFAGSAQSLNGSLIVNPWNTAEVANSIFEAITMPADVKRSSHETLFKYVTKYTASYWGLNFIKELHRMCEQFDDSKLKKLEIETVLKMNKKSTKKKMILLDYDSTFKSTHRLPEFAMPSSELLKTLKLLTEKENLSVYILSGRSRSQLDVWFSDVGVGLISEHGCFYRHPNNRNQFETSPMKRKHSIATSDISFTSGRSTTSEKHTKKMMLGEWHMMVDTANHSLNPQSWREIIRPLFQHYTERTPGSFVEEKEINLTWHYANCDPEFGQWQAAELQMNVEKILSHMSVSIMIGNKRLELRPSTINKAIVTKSIMRDIALNSYQEEIDFVLAIGDSNSEEVLFQFLNEQFSECSIGCTVERKQTDAKYYLENGNQVDELMKALSIEM